jgi:ferredoxin-NADP reductase
VTTPQLLAWIGAAIAFQLALGIAFSWSRRAPQVSPAAGDAEGDISTAASAAWRGWREFRVSGREIEDHQGTQCSFTLTPVDGLPLPPFRPGQYLTFALHNVDRHIDANGADSVLTRCYSLSERPDPSRYRITVKRMLAPPGDAELAAGRASGYFHDRVEVDDTLMVKAPAGHFCIDDELDVPLVLVAGGVGITPLMSMLRWCLDEQPGRTVHLYYGLRHVDEYAFRAQLEAFAAGYRHFHLNAVCSRLPAAELAGIANILPGYVDIELLRRTLPHGRHQFYVCGPAPMMESLVPALLTWGVPAADIHFEAFGPASVRLAQAKTGAADAAGFEVKFARSGRTLQWDGEDENLLDFAERHGISIDSGCRAGSCGSCETKLASGSVRYANPPDHELGVGRCLPCVGKPGSALVLDA